MSEAVRRWVLWRDLRPRDGAQNMALDMALLERAARARECWLRLYTWWPHCLSFGRHEPAERRYDRMKIEQAGLSVVRRPTGGRSVWHARELTYAIAAPVDVMGDLRSAYQEIHRLLAGALNRLGVQVALADAGGSVRLEAGSCFSRPAGGELMFKGRKVVGSAQLRESGALLQHGSILLGGDQRAVGAFTRGEAPADGSATLGELLGHEVTAEEVALAVTDAAQAHWSEDWSDPPEPEALLREAEPHLPRFRSKHWTWSR